MKKRGLMMFLALLLMVTSLPEYAVHAASLEDEKAAEMIVDVSGGIPTSDGALEADMRETAEDTLPTFAASAPVSNTVTYNNGEAMIISVSFDKQNGECDIEENIICGDSVLQPEDPICEGKRFENWYADAECTVLFDFSSPVREDTCIYAAWVEDEAVHYDDELIEDSGYMPEPLDDEQTYKEDDDTVRGDVDDPVIYTTDNTATDVTDTEDTLDGENPWGDIIPEDRPSSVAEVPQGIWVAGISETGYPYCGAVIEPEVRVYRNIHMLSAAEYMTEYRNNLNVSEGLDERTAPTIKITETSLQNESISVSFQINPKDIVDRDIICDEMKVEYSNEILLPEPTVRWETYALEKNKDYVVSYYDADGNIFDSMKKVFMPGNYEMSLEGIGNYTGSRKVSLTVTASKDIVKDNAIGDTKEKDTAEAETSGKQDFLSKESDDETVWGEIAMKDRPDSPKKIPAGLWASDVEDCIYTGLSIKPEIRVYFKNKQLVYGRDYTITYKNNKKAASKNAGKNAPTVTIKGQGIYAETVTREFTIQRAELTASNIVIAKTYKAGKAYSPVVQLGANILTVNKDYTLKYLDQDKRILKKRPTKEGKYFFCIAGKGNCEGVVEIPYTLSKNATIMNISKGKATVKNITYGSEADPAVSLKVGKTVLKRDRDYIVSFIGTDAKGTATALFTGIGNYHGTIKKSFKVKAASLKDAVISKDPSMEYAKSSQDPVLMVRIHGETLINGIDYTVSYKRNAKTREVKAIVKGKGNYSGSKTIYVEK